MQHRRVSALLGLALAASLAPMSTADARPVLGSITAPAPAAAADPDLDVAAVKAHLQKLQDIADQNGGNRATGQPGYKASVDYVKSKLDEAGYTTDVQEFSTDYGTSYNVIAEMKGTTDPDSVVMAGSHLDSVESGPGINDNGSGSAAVLESAIQYAKSGQKPRNTLRFGFWGAEEQGLLGSEHYGKSLSESERGRIKAYVNFDMIASPNRAYMVYDDNEAGNWIRDDLTAWYKAKNIESDYTDPQGRSDHAAFRSFGIPTGGIFSGAEEQKTQEQADKWGGTAGEAYDKCYHQSCDNMSNLDEQSLDVSSDIVAKTVWTYSAKSFGGGGEEPTPTPTDEPTSTPTDEPTSTPTDEPQPQPTDEPQPQPTDEPMPTDEPTEEPYPTEEPMPEDPSDDPWGDWPFPWPWNAAPQLSGSATTS